MTETVKNVLLAISALLFIVIGLNWLGVLHFGTAPRLNVYNDDQRVRQVRHQEPRQYGNAYRVSRPTVNCGEMGGKRTVNPYTGKKSCFVPD